MISNPLFIAVGLQILQNSKRIFSFIKPMLAKNLWITALFGQKNLWITTKTLIFAPIFNKLDPS